MPINAATNCRMTAPSTGWICSDDSLIKTLYRPKRSAATASNTMGKLIKPPEQDVRFRVYPRVSSKSHYKRECGRDLTAPR